jgi:hypothetical protein
MAIQLDRDEIVSAIKYTAARHGKAMARDLLPGFMEMARPKTKTTQLEAKVEAALKRKHGGGVFAIFKRS